MIRRLSTVALFLLLTACGGGGAPTANVAEPDVGGSVDARTYEGDNLTSIDAAAVDAAIQPLAPDTPHGDLPGNAAAE